MIIIIKYKQWNFCRLAQSLSSLLPPRLPTFIDIKLRVLLSSKPSQTLELTPLLKKISLPTKLPDLKLPRLRRTHKLLFCNLSKLISNKSTTMCPSVSPSPRTLETTELDQLPPRLVTPLRTTHPNWSPPLRSPQMMLWPNKMPTTLPPWFSTTSNSKIAWRNSVWSKTMSLSSLLTDWSPSKSFTCSNKRAERTT